MLQGKVMYLCQMEWRNQSLFFFLVYYLYFIDLVSGKVYTKENTFEDVIRGGLNLLVLYVVYVYVYIW